MTVDDNDTQPEALTIEALRLRLANVDEPREKLGIDTQFHGSGHGGANYQRVLASLRLEASRREDTVALEWEGVVATLEAQVNQLLRLADDHREIIESQKKGIAARDDVIRGLRQINSELKAAIEAHVAHLNAQC